MSDLRKQRYLEFVNAKTGEVGDVVDVTFSSDHNREKCRRGMLRNIGRDWFVRDTGDDDASRDKGRSAGQS